jgi:hypothetical protein
MSCTESYYTKKQAFMSKVKNESRFSPEKIIGRQREQKLLADLLRLI